MQRLAAIASFAALVAISGGLVRNPAHRLG